jgi:hypothetical protein
MEHFVAENCSGVGLRLADQKAGFDTAKDDDPLVGGVSDAVLAAVPLTTDAISDRERHEKIQGLAGREIGEVRVGDADNRNSGAI